MCFFSPFFKDIKAGEFSQPIHIFHNFLLDAKTDTVTIFMEETLRQRLLDTDAWIACFNKYNSRFKFITPLANTATRRYSVVQNVQTRTSLDVQVKHNIHIHEFLVHRGVLVEWGVLHRPSSVELTSPLKPMGQFQ